MKKIIDKNKFGPWAIITGASSGIGEGFARQLAADGLNLVLVARRISLMEKLGDELAKKCKIKYRVIEADLSDEMAIKKITDATDDLEVGLLISNAGAGYPGRFFAAEETDHRYILQLNVTSHVSLTHYFGRKMVARNKGGIVLTGAMGATHGVPYMANAGATKGYISTLGNGLHTELEEFGVHMTVLLTSPIDTANLTFGKVGFTKENTPVQPISVEQCVSETLLALRKNKIAVIPGLKFRMMNALTPGILSRAMISTFMKKNKVIV
ncbi:MAG TPA: SDR family NAD(P)-dependent oxidoreductase [Bacteroidia bacterium]|jgi:short-subunit dehydrogenase|nr:SDR family NAD(P)-dependent oxidoreductase [Bacteroidia bacterium]